MLVVEDSILELLPRAEGDVSEEESRILEIIFQQVITVITCLVTIFHSILVTKFQ